MIYLHYLCLLKFRYSYEYLTCSIQKFTDDASVTSKTNDLQPTNVIEQILDNLIFNYQARIKKAAIAAFFMR